ncbi:MAG: hypothetical protein ACJ72N_06860 [Labedaea sp.]
MATPPITASTRYFDAGTTKVYFLPTVAATNLTPTRPEMDAGTDLSPEVADLSGWSVASGLIDTPDLATTFTGNIPGRTNSPESSITFYASQNGTDVRALLPRGTSGYIMWCDGGDVGGNKADVFPVRVRALPKMRSVGEEAKRIEVQFAITRQPAENITVPA